MPPSSASPPAAATPAATAASSISPDSRVSRMISTRAGRSSSLRTRAVAARAERERELGGQELARDAADTVGAEQLAGGGGGRRAH